MKLPVPTKGSRMWTPGSPRERPNSSAQDFVHGADHEVDDGLGRVDDAVGVGHLDGVALEEAFVDGVEEVLLVGEIGHGGGGGFDGDVEAVEGLEELVAAEVLGGEGVDDLFDLAGR